MPSPNSEYDKGRIAELEACIGYSKLGSKHDIGEDLVFAPAVAAIALIPTREERKNHTYKLDRRRFLNGIILGITTGGLWTIVDAISLYKTKSNLDDLKQNAEYLDNVYARVFKK